MVELLLARTPQIKKKLGSGLTEMGAGPENPSACVLRASGQRLEEFDVREGLLRS